MNHNITGSRLFHIDRECYVLYMGKPERMYRPFLRIGNSEHLPKEILPYIGSVVLSERLTGNCFIESSCLEASSKRPINYVGDHELVQAITRFVNNKQVTELPLSSGSKERRSKGGNVIFYVDGNLRILLDGHRLFDLFEREKDNHHHVDVIGRIENHLNTAHSSLVPEDLERTGFISLKDNSLALFHKGIVQPCNLKGDSVERMAEAMIPPSMVRRFAGQVQKESLLHIAKWHKTRGNTIECVCRAQGEEYKFISFLTKAGVKVTSVGKQVEQQYLDVISLPDKVPFAPNSFLTFTQTDSSLSIKELKLPKGESWMHATPPILPGIPYYLPDNSDVGKERNEQPSLELFMETAGQDIVKGFGEAPDHKAYIDELMGNRKIDAATKLSVLLWMWNHLGITNNSQAINTSAQHIADCMLTLQHDVLLPARAELVHLSAGWTILFSMKQGTNKQTLHSWNTARGKIAGLAQLGPKEDFFKGERERLREALNILLKKDDFREESLLLLHDSADPTFSTKPDTQQSLQEDWMDETPKKETGSKKSGKAVLAAALIIGILAAILLIIFIPRSSASEVASDVTPEIAPEAVTPGGASETAPDAASETAPEGSTNSVDSPAATEAGEESAVQKAQESDDTETTISEISNVGAWTLQEVLFITNWISYNNGYDLVGVETVLERDPNWIFPGNSFTLPDKSNYVVAEGESIWLIANNFLDQAFIKSGMNEDDFHAFIRNLDYNQNILF